MMRDIAADAIKHEAERRVGWFRPFVLAILILVLINTCVVGGAIVLVVRQIITLPPGLIAVLTGGNVPITIQATTILDRIQSLSDLVTTRYNYSSLVTSQREMPGILNALYGDKLMMVAVGRVNAGIDMSQVTISDITRQGDTMIVKLPPPKLLDCFLDERSSYVVQRDTGFFSKPAPNMDVEARRFAVGQFRDMALKGEILSEVQKHATQVVQELVTGLGVKKVEIQT